MKLRPPDSSLADYHERFTALAKELRTRGVPPRERLVVLREWASRNSPFSPTEKLANLSAALFARVSEHG